MGKKPSDELIAQLKDDPSQAECPQCGETGFYDNRNSPKRGKGPAFKCKNKDCDDGSGFPYGVFLREPKEASGKGAPRRVVTWKQIRTAYAECVALALKGAEVIGKTGTPVVAENITTMANSLMMTREKTGCWPGEVPATEPEKPKPAKPPAPKKPGFEDFSDAPAEDDDLPF